MTRLVTFADGFTSASMPDVTPGAQEDFNILDNQSVATALVNANAEQLEFDDSRCLSAIVNFELERLDDTDTFRQTGEFKVIKKPLTGWTIEHGIYSGDDLLQESTISNPEHVVLLIDSTTGLVTYKSGDMADTNPEGTLKTIITRFLI